MHRNVTQHTIMYKQRRSSRKGYNPNNTEHSLIKSDHCQVKYFAPTIGNSTCSKFDKLAASLTSWHGNQQFTAYGIKKKS